ncbi:MAG: ATP-binding protein [Thermodesulfovibrionales bacterium]
MTDELHKDPASVVVNSQKQWQATVDAITDLIFVIGRDRLIKRVNVSFSARFNRHPKEVIGMRVDELFKLEIPHASCLLERAFSLNQAVEDEVTIGPQTYIISVYPVVLDSPNDEDASFVCVMKNVTEMKKLRDQLYNSYKLASIGQLVSGVAHEINNPLTGILGFSELLLLRVKDDAVRKELQKVYKSAERCKVIVEGLLCFSRQQQPHRGLEYINEVLDKTIDLRAYWLKSKGIAIVREYQDTPLAYVDVQQIQHAILNILMNAEQAVLLSGRPAQIVFRTAYDKEGKKIIIGISDNGSGIPEHIRGNIFDPFYTTKPVGEGSGLGLSMTYGIIAEHGGTITVDSTEGEGSTFVIELPINKPGSDQDVPA